MYLMKKVYIARNSGNSRPLCDRCKCRCKDTLVFKWAYGNLCTLKRLSELSKEEKEEEPGFWTKIAKLQVIILSTLQ